MALGTPRIGAILSAIRIPGSCLEQTDRFDREFRRGTSSISLFPPSSLSETASVCICEYYVAIDHFRDRECSCECVSVCVCVCGTKGRCRSFSLNSPVFSKSGSSPPPRAYNPAWQIIRRAQAERNVCRVVAAATTKPSFSSSSIANHSLSHREVVGGIQRNIVCVTDVKLSKPKKSDRGKNTHTLTRNTVRKRRVFFLSLSLSLSLSVSAARHEM